MLIDKPEPIVFDFDNDWRESIDTLESEIMFTSGRPRYLTTDPDGELLIGLLHQQCIRVYAQKYSLAHEATPEEYQAADRFASLVSKCRSGSLRHALRIFQKHEPLNRRNEYNALFYPEPKIYVRFGDLYPAKLLAMLGKEQSNGVVLFRDCVDSSMEDRFFIFTLGISKDDYLALMEQEREKKAEELALALHAFHEKSKRT